MDAAADPTVAPTAAADPPPGVDRLVDRFSTYAPIWCAYVVGIAAVVAVVTAAAAAAAEVVVHDTIQSLGCLAKKQITVL